MDLASEGFLMQIWSSERVKRRRIASASAVPRRNAVAYLIMSS
jgi:hypothetical protein